MREFGIRPNRDLGQNFLVDSNILDVIGRAAELTRRRRRARGRRRPRRALSEYLAERTAHVHVVELDRGLEPALRDALDPHPNTTLHMGDAVKLDLTTLDPPPDKVVANLPYGVAATVILQTIELASVHSWVAMVQKEVGERFAAGPSTPAYGVPSVLAQLACDVRVVRKIPRGVFTPCRTSTPCSSASRRHSPAPPESLRTLVQHGFAHRRKALARSLSLAPNPAEAIRDRTREALEALGHPADARAESLSPARLARALGAPVP